MAEDQWVDEVAIERAMCNRKVGRVLTEAERLEIARRLHAEGKGRAALARVLHCNGDRARLVWEAAFGEGVTRG